MSDKKHGHEHGHKQHEKPVEHSAAVTVTGAEDGASLELLLQQVQAGALAGDANAIAAMTAIQNALLTFGQQQEAAKLAAAAAATAATSTAHTAASAGASTADPGAVPVAVSASMETKQQTPEGTAQEKAPLAAGTTVPAGTHAQRLLKQSATPANGLAV